MGEPDSDALGVLFEILTGQCAFKAANYHGWAQQHLHTQPQAPSSLRPELKNWRGLDALVLRLLAKSPDQRPKNTLELVKELDAILYVEAEAQTDATKANQQGGPRFAATRGSIPTGLTGAGRRSQSQLVLRQQRFKPRLTECCICPGCASSVWKSRHSKRRGRRRLHRGDEHRRTPRRAGS